MPLFYALHMLDKMPANHHDSISPQCFPGVLGLGFVSCESQSMANQRPVCSTRWKGTGNLICDWMTLHTLIKQERLMASVGEGFSCSSAWSSLLCPCVTAPCCYRDPCWCPIHVQQIRGSSGLPISSHISELHLVSFILADTFYVNKF